MNGDSSERTSNDRSLFVSRLRDLSTKFPSGSLQASDLREAAQLLESSDETDDARDAVRYRWLKAEDRKRMPLATISWRQRSSNLPCKLADSDPLDALIDAAIASPDASVEQIYNSAVKADERPAPLAHGLRHCPTCGEELGEDGHHKSGLNGGI